MHQETSVKGNIVSYLPESIEHDIEEILKKRFEGDDFLEKTMEDLHDPYLLSGMSEAVSRIIQAKDNNEKVVIFGDYDVDGVTSTSILMHFFKKIGLQASYRLPHRIKDGYGLKSYFIDELKALGVTLVITVDCGTRDVEIIRYAKSIGVDVIVTDHHSVPEIIPEEAVAIINPKRLDCRYPFKNLAGAGVAFKLMSALAKHYLPSEEYRAYLLDSVDIAAMGTVADCMVLTGENRIIVTHGLKQLRKSRSKAIRLLIEEKLNDDLDADIFGFTIGPILNSAGRMDTPYKAVNFLLNNGDNTPAIVADLVKLNEERKFFTKQFVEDALGKVNKQDNVLFYVSPAIEHGIIGIVAGRLTEQFYRPSIVLKDEGEKLVASCRSPEFFSIVELLERHKDMFISFGGHKQAAGFSIEKSKFSAFKTALLNDVNAQDFSVHKKKICVDKVVRLEELGFGFLKKVEKYKPFGIGNMKPLFMVKHIAYDKLEFLGQGRDHLKFTTPHGFKILGFFMGDYYEEIKRKKAPVSIIFDLGQDSWMGKKSLVLKIVDIVVHG